MNNSSKSCPVCETGSLSAALHDSSLQHNGTTLLVRGLEGYRCDSCDADPIFTDQIKRNQIRIADAKRTADGLLQSDQICSVRKLLGLSQADAARVFGGGGNAFSKYERGEVVQSVPMDRLLRLLADSPALVHQLASYAGVSLHLDAVADQSYMEAPVHVTAAIHMRKNALRGKLVVVSSADWFLGAA
jgi:HTH-type transcriptional regulator/antitoxin MqsA